MSAVPNSGRSERALIVSTTGLLLAAVLPQYLIGSLAVEMRSDFQFTDAQLGAAVGISFALSAVISPAAGRTVNWVGVKRGVILAAALTTVGSMAMATLADSALAVIGLMAVIGLGGGIGSPSFSVLLAAEVGPARHGTAFGMFTSAPQVAAFAAGLALPLVAQPFGWRVAFVAPAAVGVASVVALARHGMPDSSGGGRAKRIDRRRLSRSVYAVAVSGALASAAGVGMRSFLVVFAVSVGFGTSAAGLLLSTTGVVAMASRVGFGVLGDRRPGRSLYRAAGLMAVCAVGFVFMAIGGHVAIVLGALLAGGLGWGWQSPLSLAVVSQNRDMTAAAIGIQMSGFFTGAVVGPLLLALFAEAGSYTAAWLVCVALTAGGATVAIFAHRLIPNAQPGAPELWNG